MIKNIVFDMGGVLIRWDTATMLDQLDLPAEDREILNRELFRTVEWMQQDRGVMTEEQLRRAVLARLPQHLWAPAEKLIGWYHEFIFPVPGMGELVRELKSSGYHIYLLSNANLALRTYFRRIPGSECFDQLMVSAEEKLLKPAHEIYERLYEKFDLNPAECFFIDDMPANVEGAIRTGMNGAVFHGDVSRLRRDLNAAGISCGA